MAELDTPSFGNFSIEDTMEMGMGNRDLLEGLISPETVTSETDDIKVIEKEPKKKEEKAKPSTEEKTDPEEEKDSSKVLNDFLSDEEKEEEIEETPTVKKKVEKTQEKKEGEEEDIEDDSKEVNRFTALAKDLFSLGVFSKDEDEEDAEISTPEQFLERFNSEKRKGAIDVVDKFIGQFGEDYQNAFQSIFVKGVDPKEYFGAYNNIKDFSSLDLAIEANQVAVIKQALTDQGLDPEDVTAEIDRLKNYGDLETVAQRHHKVLIKKEVAKVAQMEQESEQKLQQQAVIKQQYVTNVQSVLQDKLKNKEFDGIPINPKLATEIQDFLVTDRYKTPTGETLTEFDRTILDLKRPENHERKVKVALLLKILEKDPTLSTIQKTGVTKKSDALFGELARQTGKSPVKTEREKVKDKPSSWFVNS